MDELEVRELLRKSCYPFLAAQSNEWIDADGKELSFDEMGKKHLQNCYKLLQKHKRNIESGIFLSGIKFDKTQYKEIVNITKRLYDDKLKELDNYLK